MSAICRQKFSTNYFFSQNTNANGRGQCQTAQFTASSDGVATPTLCGTNTGYHMILNADVSEKLVGDATASLGWSLHFKNYSSFGYGLELLLELFFFLIGFMQYTCSYLDNWLHSRVECPSEPN